jgi:hypothetical protein
MSFYQNVLKLCDISLQKSFFSSGKCFLNSEVVEEFCDSTSLHGWAFFGGKSSDGKWTPNGLFWLAVIVVSIVSAVYVVGYTIKGHPCVNLK